MRAKLKLINTIGVLILFILTVQYSDVLARGSVELGISFDKSEYKKSDPININFTLKNNTKKEIYVNKRFFVNSEKSLEKYREVYFTVKSPQAEKLSFRTSYETGLPKSDYFILLKPGEKVESERKRNMRAYFDFKDIGDYEITAVYQNVYGNEIGLKAFKDEIKSEPITIKIVE